MTNEYKTNADDELAQVNWVSADLEQFSEEELKRVLWLGACGKIHLPQSIGSDIDEEIQTRKIHAEETRLKMLGEMWL